MRRQRQLLATTTSSNDTHTNNDNYEDFQHQLGAFTKAYGNPAKQPTKQEELEELRDLLLEFNTTKEAYYRNRRRHLQGPSDRSQATYNPSLGTFVVPLLLMIFTDHANRPLPEKYEYQILWNLRIRKWIDENSYGKYEAFFDVQDWEMTDNTEAHYSFGQGGRTSRFQQSFYPLLDNMDARLGGDWSLYDANSDGELDNLIVIHSGYAAEEGGEDCNNGRGQMDRIWSHAFADSSGWYSLNGNYRVRGYNIASSLDLKCGDEPGKMGVMTHEYMHTFYLIDLYDIQFIGKGLGNFDIMAYPYGLNNDGYIPVNLGPWAKETVEWQTCQEITRSGEYTIEPAAFVDNCYKIILNDLNTKFQEYILLENRQQLSFDINFWEPGLVMYHIDDAAQDQMRVGYPGINADWPESGNHYRVSVIQADGQYDLERSNNSGEKGDIWQPGDRLGPNSDGQTFPNTDSYQDGFIERTGIVIEVLEGQGMNVKVKVTLPARSGQSSRPADFSAPQKDPAWTELAEEQFTDPDSDQKISGMIPQLAWFEEWREKTYRQSSTTFTSSTKGQDKSGGGSVTRQGWLGSAGVLVASVVVTTLLGSVGCGW